MYMHGLLLILRADLFISLLASLLRAGQQPASEPAPTQDPKPHTVALQVGYRGPVAAAALPL